MTELTYYVIIGLHVTDMARFHTLEKGLPDPGVGSFQITVTSVCVCVLCHHCCMGCFTMLNVYYMFGAPAPGHWIFPSVGISVPM